MVELDRMWSPSDLFRFRLATTPPTVCMSKVLCTAPESPLDQDVVPRLIHIDHRCQPPGNPAPVSGPAVYVTSGQRCGTTGWVTEMAPQLSATTCDCSWRRPPARSILGSPSAAHREKSNSHA